MLKLKDVVVHYGVIEAIKGVSFEVKKGEIVSLIGANGAGKTTILTSISCLIQPTSGEILYKEKPSMKASTRDIVASGISQVPEGRRVFSGMTVKENLEMGAFLRKDHSEIQKDLKRVYESFPILKERLNQDAQTLSGGEQQMLAMGRALLSNPELLLLDVPSMGLAPLCIREIFNIIEEISERGTTILLVEQAATIALAVSHRGHVIETRKSVASGSAQELLDSDEVKKAYLGG